MEGSINKTIKTKNISEILILFLVIFTLIAGAFYFCYQMFYDLQHYALSGREAVASLTASIVKERLDRIIDVGVSLSTKAQFQQLVEAGKYDEAIKTLERVSQYFPYITRISLFDKQGTLKTVTPLTPDVASLLGKDFSYRDYYQGVKKEWQPYVAEVIKPMVPLGYNLVPIAIPIKSGRDSDVVLGFILLSVKLDTISSWTQNIDVGPGGFIYIVDHKGHLVAHPHLLPAEDVINFSSVVSVQRVLAGERGVDIVFNQIENEERVTAYEPVAQYGWGAVVVQPTRTAFAHRDADVSRMIIIWVLIIVIIGVFTYRLLRDRALIKSQRDREHLLLESIGDGIIVIDRNFNIISWNKAAAALTGWEREQVLGKPMREFVRFIRELDKKESIVFIEETMLYGEQKTMEPNTLLVRKNGTEIHVGDSAAPVFDSSGKVSGAIIIFRDISGEREIQKTREQTIAQTVHDLRAPATAIKLAAEFYSDSDSLAKDPEALKKGVEIIKQANTRMLDLVNSLLERAKGANGVVGRERVILSNIIQDILREFDPVATKKNVKIEYTSQKEPLYVLANVERLKEIFSNLIDNAIKYNKNGGIVTITHALEGSLIKTAIHDTGIGVSSADFPKLFAPYFRVNTEDNIQGTGLGLFTVKKFTEEIGGRVEVISVFGEGSTFSVFLPINQNK